LSLKSLRKCIVHTFPLLSFLGARISGTGIGGRDIASLIASPDLGVSSLEKLVFLDGTCFLGLVGVCADPDDPATGMTSAARTAPRLVRFSVHATRWKVGEVVNSRGRFLDIAETRNCRVMRSDHSRKIVIKAEDRQARQDSVEKYTENRIPH
jgi:hypothetical protein